MVCKEGWGGRPKVKEGLSLDPMLVHVLGVEAGGGGVRVVFNVLEGTLWGQVITILGSMYGTLVLMGLTCT